MWLLEAGFKYTGRVYDTMLGEYILNRGIRKSLTLEMSCRRRRIGSKDSRIKEFTDRGIPFQNIPADVVEEYGRIDVQITRDLFNSQMADFKMPKNKHLLMTAKMMNEFLIVLSSPKTTRASPSVSINKQPLTVLLSTLAEFPEPVPRVVTFAPARFPSILCELEG